MSAPRKVVLIHPRVDDPGMPELTEALRRRGAEVEQLFLAGNFSQVLDAIEGDVLPVIVKGRRAE